MLQHKLIANLFAQGVDLLRQMLHSCVDFPRLGAVDALRHPIVSGAGHTLEH
jgi:hypothetical protein